jgi:hypothetical protein
LSSQATWWPFRCESDALDIYDTQTIKPKAKKLADKEAGT